MKKFRVIGGLILLSSLLVTMTACSGGGETKKAEKKENTAQTSKVEMSVEGEATLFLMVKRSMMKQASWHWRSKSKTSQRTN